MKGGYYEHLAMCGETAFFCTFIFYVPMKQLSQKKRFMVLERDWFCCKYCGQKPPFVQLEVDHIIPKSKWWKDILENLITACFNCNRWKWSTEVWWDNKNLYKTKINEAIYKCKMEFYGIRNKNNMWSICTKTKVLLSMYTKINFDRQENLSVYSYYNDLDNKEQESLFLLWWDLCDTVLNRTIESTNMDYSYYIDTVLDDDHWTWSDEYGEKLNYLLTESLKNNVNYYVLYKYTLFPKLLNNE